MHKSKTRITQKLRCHQYICFISTTPQLLPFFLTLLISKLRWPTVSWGFPVASDWHITANNSTRQLATSCTPSPPHSLPLLSLLPFSSTAIQVPTHLTSSCCRCHEHLADATRACHLAICQASAMHIKLDISPPALTQVCTLLDMH